MHVHMHANLMYRVLQAGPALEDSALLAQHDLCGATIIQPGV